MKRFNLRKFNIPMAKRVREQLLRFPDNFNMSSWYEEIWIPREQGAYGQNDNCGTAACIAGWIVALDLAGKQLSLPIINPNPMLFRAREKCNNHPEDRAAKLIGLTVRQAQSLFLQDEWPEPYRQRFNRAEDGNEEAQVAVDYLTSLIDRAQRQQRKVKKKAPKPTGIILKPLQLEVEVPKRKVSVEEVLV